MSSNFSPKKSSSGRTTQEAFLFGDALYSKGREQEELPFGRSKARPHAQSKARRDRDSRRLADEIFGEIDWDEEAASSPEESEASAAAPSRRRRKFALARSRKRSKTPPKVRRARVKHTRKKQALRPATARATRVDRTTRPASPSGAQAAPTRPKPKPRRYATRKQEKKAPPSPPRALRVPVEKGRPAKRKRRAPQQKVPLQSAPGSSDQPSRARRPHADWVLPLAAFQKRVDAVTQQLLKVWHQWTEQGVWNELTEDLYYMFQALSYYSSEAVKTEREDTKPAREALRKSPPKPALTPAERKAHLKAAQRSIPSFRKALASLVPLARQIPPSLVTRRVYGGAIEEAEEFLRMLQTHIKGGLADLAQPKISAASVGSQLGKATRPPGRPRPGPKRAAARAARSGEKPPPPKPAPSPPEALSRLSESPPLGSEESGLEAPATLAKPQKSPTKSAPKSPEGRRAPKAPPPASAQEKPSPLPKGADPNSLGLVIPEGTAPELLKIIGQGERLAEAVAAAKKSWEALQFPEPIRFSVSLALDAFHGVTEVRRMPSRDQLIARLSPEQSSPIDWPGLLAALDAAARDVPEWRAQERAMQQALMEFTSSDPSVDYRVAPEWVLRSRLSDFARMAQVLDGQVHEAVKRLTNAKREGTQRQKRWEQARKKAERLRAKCSESPPKSLSGARADAWRSQRESAAAEAEAAFRQLSVPYGPHFELESAWTDLHLGL